MIIDAFKNNIFPLNNPDDFPTYVSEGDRSSISEGSSYSDEDKLNEMITEKDNTINKELFIKHFTFQNLFDMQKRLSKTLGTQANKQIVQIIKSGLVDLNKETKKMSED